MKLVASKTPEQEKYKNHIKHINEYYDEHINEILPDYLHRGDIVTSNRMLGYADAMMATCATFLVIPLRNLKEMKPDETLSHFIHENRSEFIMFFLGFLVVLTIWESINVRAIFIKRLDDTLVLMGILALLLSTILPFSISLQGHFPNEEVAIITTCLILLLLEVLEIFMIFYAFATPRVLHVAMHQWSKKEFTHFRNTACIKALVNSFIVIVGGTMCLLHYIVSWAFIAVIVLMPLIRKFFLLVRRRRSQSNPPEAETCQFFWYFSRGNISKERVEAMSDAAIAIIACILMLDITVEEFPTREKVKAHGLNKELEHMSTEFITFFGSYLTVSMLWYTNHTVLHLFHTVNVVLLYFQKLFLAFACLCPLGSNMMFKFIQKDNHDSVLALRLSSTFILLSSLFNLLMLLWGFHTKDKYLHKWAAGTCFRANLRQHVYIVLKVLTIPVCTIASLFASLASPDAMRHVSRGTFVITVVIFIILKVIFMNHWGKEVYNAETDKRQVVYNKYAKSENKETQEESKVDVQIEVPASQNDETVIRNTEL